MKRTSARVPAFLRTSFVLLLFFLGAASHAPLVIAQSAGTFTATGDMTSRRFFHTATLLTDGRVLIAGGTMIEGNGPNIGLGLSNKALGGAELYDPHTGAFTATGNMTTPRDGHTATLLPDGKVLIAGGGIANDRSFASPTLASAELYDPDTGTFSATGDMTTPRWGHIATLLNSGKVLIVGGFQGPAELASAELYDPSTGIFTAAGNMTSPWADTATLLPNGKVLITKGNPEGPPPYLSSSELYDSSIGTFASAGYLTANHTAPTAVLLTNGKVLIAGGDMGDGDGASSIAELYDPATGTFALTGNMTTGREQHTAALLPDGTVLFTGGHNAVNLATSAELYDPVKGTFSATGAMRGARELHAATLLKDGRILIAGGDDERYWQPDTILSTAELYRPVALVPAPVLFSLSGDGRGQGAILHANTPRVVSSSDPAVAGEYLEIYLTGLTDGSVSPPQVSIGGRMAEMLYFGKSGYAGLNQVNVRVPGGVAPGPAVPVRLTYLNRPSNEVTIGVQ